MKRKAYTRPMTKAHEVHTTTVVCTSPPPYSGPLGVKGYRNFDEDDEWDDEEIGSGIW